MQKQIVSQCQHVESGRCARCADPMNPKHYHTVNNTTERRLFDSIDERNRMQQEVRKNLKKFRKVLTS